MLECQRQLGVERGKRMAEMVLRVTGKVCPCLRGEQCILLPRQREVPEPERVGDPGS